VHCGVLIYPALAEKFHAIPAPNIITLIDLLVELPVSCNLQCRQPTLCEVYFVLNIHNTKNQQCDLSAVIHSACQSEQLKFLHTVSFPAVDFFLVALLYGVHHSLTSLIILFQLSLCNISFQVPHLSEPVVSTTGS